ncbi:lipopolysaccharide biosynthesis protein [Bosea sp. NBC_00550]|uniref:lipopolysaccharide biosynthesis protein n=1 Tax=Bosea sp. NBC_00550 TaxID=2969621 RepID=UPI002232C414|nr:oligosaccharide flippase family protein [Bosea sp. NBC_00550]UZF94393.1 oligosaccharide flippase family protein [Bosea sp. NBC_00550]
MSVKLASRNLVFYLLNYGTRFLSPVIVTPIVAKTLGPSVFSDYVVWNAVVWISVLLMEFGFYLYALNATAAAENGDELGSMVSGVLTAKLMLAPFALTSFLASAFAMGLTTREPIAVSLGLCAVFTYGLNFGWYFQGLQRGGVAVLIEAVPQLTQLLLVLALVQGPDQLWRVAALQTLAALATTSCGWILLRRDRLRLRLLRSRAIGAIRAAVPYFAERGAFTLYSTATPIIILALSTPDQVAFYGLAEKVNTVLIALVMAATPAISPLTIRHARRSPPDWRLSVKVVTGITSITILAAVVIFAGIGFVVEHFLGAVFAEAIVLARLFCVVSVIMAFQLSVSNFIILPSGRSALLFRVGGVALLVTLTLQALLVPKYGAAGSVIARLCSELAVGIILSVVAFRVVRRA